MIDELQRKIDDATSEIDSIESWIKDNSLDRNTQYLIKYSIIRACSTIEVVFKNIMYNKLIESCNKEAKEYMKKKILESSMNPRTGNMENLLQEVNPTWKAHFQEKLKEINDKKSDLNSLVGLRNDFAHGDSISVTIKSVKRYYSSGITILHELEKVIES
jgi:hypothetical protein